jgi:hypothetical protein
VESEPQLARAQGPSQSYKRKPQQNRPLQPWKPELGLA